MKADVLEIGAATGLGHAVVELAPQEVRSPNDGQVFRRHSGLVASLRQLPQMPHKELKCAEVDKRGSP